MRHTLSQECTHDFGDIFGETMLTDQAIRAMKPPETGYRIEWDGKLPGFGCRITARGTRAFVVLIASGRPKTIGRWGLISLADARREAKLLLANRAIGKIAPARTAFADAVQSYLDDCAATVRPGTLNAYQRLLKRFAFGRTAIADVKPRDILATIMPLPPSERHHAYAALRIFFRWCLHQHLIDRSPMENLKAPPLGKSRERVLSEDEIKAIWKATEAPWCAYKAIVRLLLLTGQRRGEIAALQWSWINEEERTITIPSSVTKNKHTHCFPYGDLTADLFADVGKMIGCPYVFPASNIRSERTTVFNNFSHAKMELNKASGVTGYVLHDLRRTYSSIMASLGVQQVVVEKLLNHAGGSMSPIASIYNRYSYMKEMREATLQFDAYLTTLVTPRA